MPHCQKENHDRQAKSKKKRLKKKEETDARKKTAKAQELEEELDKAKSRPNNIALADGHGEYEVGCEEEKELKARFNVNKRSKKHLRNDIRKQQERKEREDQEQLQRDQEEQYQVQQQRLKQEAAGQEEEEEPLTEEYLVYICQCCRKKFNTTNQFVNHSNSKKHRDNAKLYEEVGVIVTDVQLWKKGHSYKHDEEEYDEYEFEKSVIDEEIEEYGETNNDAESSDSDSEKAATEPIRKSMFAAFADSASSNSSSNSSESSKKEDDGDDEEISAASIEQIAENVDDDQYEYYDDFDLLEEIIYQNRLQNRFYSDYDTTEVDEEAGSIVAIPFDNDRYNPEHYDANENRLASVQHRLQKRLAAKGIEPSQVNTGYRTSDVVSMGKTLLQDLMEAGIETMQAKLEAYNKHKAECQLLGREFKFAKGNSKALPSQYTFRKDPADNSRRRENTHHAGSHYHMQAARSMQFGRSKGLMARHSAQGSRLQASRTAAKEMASMQGKGANIRKTSKKSQQKRRGEAGGSKKAGGTAGE